MQTYTEIYTLRASFTFLSDDGLDVAFNYVNF